MDITASDPKAETFAKLIDGAIVDDSERVAVCIKGVIDGFPATFEAIYKRWPFGVVYTVELNQGAHQGDTTEQITIYPRFGRGIAGIFTKIFLFEGGGMPITDKRLGGIFNINYQNREAAERLIHYPGMSEYLHNLNAIAKFNELILRPGVGIYLSQPNSFNAVEANTIASSFKILSAMAKVLQEAF